MFKIEEGKIYLTRGDTAYLYVKLVYPNGEPFKADENDVVTMTVKKTTDKDAEVIFQKIVPADNVAIVIEPEDTTDLDYGKYKYDVQLNTAKGEVFTVIGPYNFYVKEEVTRDLVNDNSGTMGVLGEWEDF